MHANVLDGSQAAQALTVMQSRKNFLAITDPEALEMQRHMAQRNLENLMDPHFASMGTVFGVWNGDVMQGLIITLFSNQQPCFFIIQYVNYINSVVQA